mmetsp:Transcript_154897/g.496340  ORF Transcript_154897/g.496340 Transcript_154897/m.496340 type:complete len:277 (+) Transcript_154897:3200-4030(+)
MHLRLRVHRVQMILCDVEQALLRKWPADAEVRVEGEVARVGGEDIDETHVRILGGLRITHGLDHAVHLLMRRDLPVRDPGVSPWRLRFANVWVCPLLELLREFGHFLETQCGPTLNLRAPGFQQQAVQTHGHSQIHHSGQRVREFEGDGGEEHEGVDLRVLGPLADVLLQRLLAEAGDTAAGSAAGAAQGGGQIQDAPPAGVDAAGPPPRETPPLDRVAGDAPLVNLRELLQALLTLGHQGALHRTARGRIEEVELQHGSFRIRVDGCHLPSSGLE